VHLWDTLGQGSVAVLLPLCIQVMEVVLLPERTLIEEQFTALGSK
jgi:hypothetical protein